MTNLYHFDWNDQNVLFRYRMAPRVHFYPYADAASAVAACKTDRVESLSGAWNFDWFDSPLKVPDALLKKSYDAKAQSICVPMNWQYAGYGKRCYTDLLYPFPVDPPHVPIQNETGVYRRSFCVKNLCGDRMYLRFEGIESAFHVYVNGSLAGYSQGSRMPSEFEITGFVCEGENQLAVVVYQYSDGTYLEDQDMWWLGGITRDVLLLRRPACHIIDFVLDPDYNVLSGEGILHPSIPLSADGYVKLTVYGQDGQLLASTQTSEGTLRVQGVRPWTAETPELYTVVAVVSDASGVVTEAVPQKIGFRHIAIEDGVLTVNGRPIFMRGVNRHEYDPKTGRAVTSELKELDTQLEPKRPHIHCEFAHAMGNGPGGLNEYFETCEHSRRIQGIFVWEFKDHGVYEKLDNGRECYRFGGEYGEKFHNGDFCMDGLVRSDGVPSPGFWEYARVAEPVHVEKIDLERHVALIKNRFDFLDLSAFECHGRVLWDGVVSKIFTVDLPAATPRSVEKLLLPSTLRDGCPEGSLATLELKFVSKIPVWSQPRAGWLAGRAGVVLCEETGVVPRLSAPACCEQEGYQLRVSGSDFSFLLDPVLGRIQNYRSGGVLLIEDGPLLNYNRAYLDNDILNRKLWDEKHMHSMRMCVLEVNWEQEQDALKIRVIGKFSPDAMDWGTDVTITYRVWDDGTLAAAFEGDFYGPVPEELPKIGTEMHIPAALQDIVWRGYGPGECYCDSKQAQTDGIWRTQAAEMGFDYSCPQDNANRTGVRWAAMVTESGEGIAVAANRPIDFAVRRFSDEQLAKTPHACELVPDSERLYVQLDYRNSGLGSGSCGPTALAQYKAYPIHFAWEMAFAPVCNGENPLLAGRRAMGRVK